MMSHVNGICPYSEQFPLKYYVSIMAPIKRSKNIEKRKMERVSARGTYKIQIAFYSGHKRV